MAITKAGLVMRKRKEDFSIHMVGIGLNPNVVQQAIANVIGQILEAQTAKREVGNDKAVEWFGEDGALPDSGEIHVGRLGELVIKVVIEPEDYGGHGITLIHDPVDGIGITGIKLTKDVN